MLLNYLQASALLLSPKDNRNQGYRMERLGLRARDREDTLGFGSNRAKMTVVAALGAGHCLENEVGLQSDNFM